MDLFTILIADQLLWQFCHLMGGICKYRTVFFFHFPCLYFCFLSQYVLCRFGQPIKVNWAYASGQREDTSGVGSVLNQ